MTFVAAFRIRTPEGREVLIPLEEIERVIDNETDPPSAVLHLQDGRLEWAVGEPGTSIKAEHERALLLAGRVRANVEEI